MDSSGHSYQCNEEMFLFDQECGFGGYQYLQSGCDFGDRLWELKGNSLAVNG